MPDLGKMADSKETAPLPDCRTEAQITLDNYVPGDAVAQIDAGIARMDFLFKSILNSAAKYVNLGSILAL